MPYIADKERRAWLNRTLHLGLETAPKDGAELNYLIFRLVRWYWEWRPKSYQRITDIRGALDGAKLEFERRFAFPYEDRKLEENGDV